MTEPITTYLTAHQTELLSFTTALINQDTNALDAASVNATLTLVEDFLASHGLTTVREQSTTANPILVADLNETATGAPLILLGHLDTVFPVGTAKQRPSVIDGERLTGPGSNDMKPGAVMAIATLLALKEANYQAHPVRLILVTDEEILHKNAPTKETIARLSKGAVAGFNFESADPDNGVVTGRKGGAIVDLTVTGIAAHSGKEPEKGRSAVLELAHQIIKAEDRPSRRQARQLRFSQRRHQRKHHPRPRPHRNRRPLHHQTTGRRVTCGPARTGRPPHRRRDYGGDEGRHQDRQHGHPAGDRGPLRKAPSQRPAPPPTGSPRQADRRRLGRRGPNRSQHPDPLRPGDHGRRRPHRPRVRPGVVHV